MGEGGGVRRVGEGERGSKDEGSTEASASVVQACSSQSICKVVNKHVETAAPVYDYTTHPGHQCTHACSSNFPRLVPRPLPDVIPQLRRKKSGSDLGMRLHTTPLTRCGPRPNQQVTGNRCQMKHVLIHAQRNWFILFNIKDDHLLSMATTQLVPVALILGTVTWLM